MNKISRQLINIANQVRSVDKEYIQKVIQQLKGMFINYKTEGNKTYFANYKYAESAYDFDITLENVSNENYIKAEIFIIPKINFKQKSTDEHLMFDPQVLPISRKVLSYNTYDAEDFIERITDNFNDLKHKLYDYVYEFIVDANQKYEYWTNISKQLR